ncbi:iron complex transport system permease protein [Halolactibacillus halophilus]|uniref:ABC transporter permease protein YclN n=1 Tax=Halolactibacillus halophilus TaxID=306540 RepID=A0A1I5R9R0_9BACI|nr:ABC transporter permease [Halolactibacillus halophilus]GEM02289.1 putative ABC transporter permease protein YclN [Halolactibacillus halophilus]SFP55223.1 iron complex transport system permease protein [Halolactibacillus halophilus]
MKYKVLIPVLIILSILSIFIGVVPLSFTDIFNLTTQQQQIILVSRIPRLISIVLAGIGLSVSGLIMQQLSRNKFVSPTTAGTMDSARLGILVAMMFFHQATPLERMFVAFIFSISGTLIFMKILDKVKFKDPIFIPLVGLMFGNIVGSITTFIAYQNDLIQNMSSWLQGNFALILEGRYELLYISVPLVVLSYIFAHRFTIAGMGEDFAKNLGLHYNLVVNTGLIIVALITSVVILTAGTIPFLGLIIPNIVSIYRGDHLKNSLPFTALLGAVFLLASDIIGRVIIFPYEVAIGVIVGVVGSFIFLYLIMRRSAYES